MILAPCVPHFPYRGEGLVTARHHHFVGIEYRLERLRFQSRRASVPELRCVESGVQDGRRGAIGPRAADPDIEAWMGVDRSFRLYHDSAAIWALPHLWASFVSMN